MTIVVVIVVTLSAAWIISLRLKRTIQNRRAIGQSITLQYADQNESIAKQLPRNGIIKDKISIGRTSDNFVVTLDRPINVEDGHVSEVVIRHRHIGQYIGSTKEIHVHLLIPKVKLVKDEYLVDDFMHAAWLTIKAN